MPDGSRLVLTGVTYGKVRSQRLGSRPRDYLAPLLPPGLARKLGCNFTSAGGSNTLVCWFRLEGSTSLSRLRAVPFDEHGCQFRLADAPIYPVAGRSGQWVVKAAMDEFPRRGKTAGVRLFEGLTNGGYGKVAEFTVPNPDRRSFPAWTAEPLPATRTNGTAGFTLVAMKGGIYGRGFPPEPPIAGEDCGTLLRFQLTEAGRPAPGWELDSIKRLSDPQGNSAALGSSSSSRDDTGQLNTVIPGGLCLQESAWRVGAEFSRVDGFPPGDLWIVRGVPVPDARSASVVNVETNLHGVLFRFCCLAGKDCASPAARISIGRSPLVHVVCPAPPPDCVFKLVSATDSQGRRAPCRSQGVDGSDWLFALELPEGAKTLDLAFAVTRRVSVDFQAKPSPTTLEDIKRLRKEWGYQ